jgi:outer membrane protein
VRRIGPIVMATALVLGGATVARAQQPEVTLSLDDAVKRALERNLDIQVERMNPQALALSIAALRSTYHPIVSSTLGQRSQVTPPSSQLNGGQRVANDTTTYNAGVTQLLPWGGGQFQLLWNNTRTDTSNIFANYNPSYNTTVNGFFSQPLLRGLAIDLNRQQLRVTQINREISEVQLRATITTTLATVRSTYWDFVFVTESLGVARQSLALAEKLVQDNQARVEAGAMAPIDVVQAEAEAAARRQALAQVEATVQTTELALKSLIVEGTQDPLWRAKIMATERPRFRPEPLDIDAAVAAALSRRTDIEQAKRQLESTDVTLKYLRNSSLPALDAVATYGLQGLGGTQFIRQGSGLGSIVIGTLPGGFGDALSAITRASFPTWNVSLNLSYPMGGNPNEAQYARAKVQRNQTLAQIKALELQVAAEVTNAALTVQSNVKRVDAATASRSLSQRRLEAEQSKFEVGLSTNFFVVQAQRDLQDAQIAELRALLDYQQSVVDFERVQETSLQRSGVSITPTRTTPSAQ